MGGSRRCPANSCNAGGLRPSLGRGPTVPARDAWGNLSVNGPMARTVAELALYLSVMAGPDARDPLSIDEDPAIFRRPLERDFKNVRIAWSPDLSKQPLDESVKIVIEGQRQVFESL